MNPVTKSKGYLDAKAKVDKLKAEAKEKEKAAKKAEKKEIEKPENKLSTNDIYSSAVGIGTENVNADDVKTPTLRLIQDSSKLELGEDEGKKVGWWYRSDTKEQIKNPIVHILSFKKTTAENYMKTEDERVHIYYGVLAESLEPFKMYLRGWNLNTSRDFLTEIKRIEKIHNLPMFALKVELQAVDQEGTIKASGKPYTIKKAVLKIGKNETGEFPLIEQDPATAKFLRAAATKLKDLVEDEKLNEESEEVFTNNKEEAIPQVDEDGIPF